MRSLSSLCSGGRLLLLACLLWSSALAFNPQADNNLVNYWGQNSFGASGGDMRYWQKPLADYCQSSNAEDVIVLAFLHVFNSAARALPQMDLSNQCEPNSAFPGSALMHCPATGAGVKACQSRGKAVLLSLGGAAGAYGFSNDAEAKDFAHTIWNLFLGGSSATRPLDDAIMDGVDLDIEGGPTVGYPAFIAELRFLFATDTRKQYYISAAPQCPFPDAYLGPTLQSAWIDMVFVQFYNNYCGTQSFGTPNFNFEQWDSWAKSTSLNKNVKVYLGVPASRSAANAGYVSKERLREIVNGLRCQYSSFGGVMMWDVSQAYGNFDSAGVSYSITTASELKRERQEVCGSNNPLPAPAPVPGPPAPAPAPPAPPVPVPPVVPEPVVPVAPAPALAVIPDVAIPVAPEPPSRPTTPEPPTVSASHDPVGGQSGGSPEDDVCPVDGRDCEESPPNSGVICDGYKFARCVHGKWILQQCAPGTYCTPHGCDFINGPVKSCSEVQEAVKAGIMQAQMKETLDRMGSKFQHGADATWDDFMADGDPLESELPSESLSGNRKEDLHQESLSEGSVKEEDSASVLKDSEPFLIDFTELNASKEFVSFTLEEDNKSRAFRTQVRIRTNGNSISPTWRVSFYVKPGEIVHTTSRGKFRQRGLKVFVRSNPQEEVEQSMVVRFVVEGVISHGANSGMFEVASLPDPAFATFETKALP